MENEQYGDLGPMLGLTVSDDYQSVDPGNPLVKKYKEDGWVYKTRIDGTIYREKFAENEFGETVSKTEEVSIPERLDSKEFDGSKEKTIEEILKEIDCEREYDIGDEEIRYTGGDYTEGDKDDINVTDSVVIRSNFS